MKLRRRERIAFGIALWFAGLVMFCGCLKHTESKVDASLTRTLDTTEPVAVPKTFRFRGWSFFKPVVSTAGGPLSPPSVSPIPDAPADLPSLLAPDGGQGVYFEGEIDYGEGTKDTHSGEAVGLKAESESDSRPAGILDLISSHWPWLLLLIPVGLLLFRKHPKLARLLKLAPPPFSWLAPKE